MFNVIETNLPWSRGKVVTTALTLEEAIAYLEADAAEKNHSLLAIDRDEENNAADVAIARGSAIVLFAIEEAR